MVGINAGIIGCGVISEVYFKNLQERFHSVKVVCCADAFAAKAQERALQFGCKAVTADEMLNDPAIDMVVNLTNPASHAEVTMSALRAGKHVYSEKPLALSLAEADIILNEAHSRGLLVGCAPDTILCAGIQTACFALESGWIGKPLSATAFWSSRGHERWHGNPAFYYQPGGGPHLDMGPYYMTALVMLLGSIKRVHAVSQRPFPERIFGAGPNRGKSFPVEIDTHYSALLETESGATVNLMLSFDVWANNLPHMEIYGTGGTLSVPDPNACDGPAKIYTPASGSFETLPLVNPFRENARGIGAAQMAKSITTGEPYLANAQLARHVLEALLAVDESARAGVPVECRTRCGHNAPLAAGKTEAEWDF
jgi:predicted dehydrogenase